MVRADVNGNFLIGNPLCREGKVDVNANDENRMSGLCHVAKLECINNAELGIAIARFLLGEGGDLNVCGKDGGTLHGAAVYD